MINWQDTVMTNVDLQREIPASNGIACLLSVRDMFLCSMTARKQAKITWEAREPEIAESRRAGVKEVMEFKCEECSTPNFVHLVIPKDKLKEWGL